MAIKKINEWDTNPNDNDFVPAEGGWPELMTRSGVNDASRINLSELRHWYNDSEWIQVRTVGPDAADIGVFARISATECQITLAGNDLTGFFEAGRVIKIIDGGSGGSSDLVTQVASSSYNNPITTINILSTAEMHASSSDIYTHSNSVLRALGLVDAADVFYIPITQDSAGINAAILLATTAGGGTVFLLAGTYAINNAGGPIDLDTRGKVILQGSGPDTILKQDNTQNMDALILLGNSFTNIIRNVTINVDRDNNPTGDGDGILVDQQARGVIEDVHFTNCEVCIRITSSLLADLVIRACDLRSYREGGVMSTASTDLHRGRIESCLFDGLAVTAVDPAAIKVAGVWTLNDNFLTNIGHASLSVRGIWLWNKVSGSSGGRLSTVAGNRVDASNAANGTAIDVGGDSNAINGNVIQCATNGIGIHLISTQAGQDEEANTVVGNSISGGKPIVTNLRTSHCVIEGNSVSPAVGKVGIEDDGDFNLISNNVIEDGATGIKVTANATNSTIRGNVITLPTASAVEIVGAASKALIQDNTLECAGNGVLVSATATDPIIKGNEIRSATTGINITSGCLRAVVLRNDTTDAATAIADAGTDTNRLSNSFDLSAVGRRRENELATSTETDTVGISALDMPCGGKAGTFLFEAILVGRNTPPGNDVTIRLYCGVNGTIADTLITTLVLKAGMGAEFSAFEFAGINAYSKWGVTSNAPSTENINIAGTMRKVSQE